MERGLVDWIVLPFRRYVDFVGRSRRKEFWLWQLFLLIAFIVLPLVDTLLGLGGASGRYVDSGPGFYYTGAFTRGGYLTGLFGLFVLLPSLAVAVRRLHDGARSGWWLLLGFIPVIGTIVLIVFFILEGTRGPNRFGPDPLETTV